MSAPGSDFPTQTVGVTCVVIVDATSDLGVQPATTRLNETALAQAATVIFFTKPHIPCRTLLNLQSTVDVGEISMAERHRLILFDNRGVGRSTDTEKNVTTIRPDWSDHGPA